MAGSYTHSLTHSLDQTSSLDSSTMIISERTWSCRLAGLGYQTKGLGDVRSGDQGMEIWGWRLGKGKGEGGEVVWH